ncbi:MAG: TrkA family potassium uptake protein [Chloroflexi bacterium]|nr:TrkA family potassium uptake protein [Chloroflexota bacterium]MBU1748204.1 TrkA family potassium uptake protein [Chloroflexota bacterium]
MNMIVIGCGRVGAQLAYRLYQQGHKVVVDPVAEAFENLPADFRGRTVEGEVLNQDVLRRAGIEQADGLAAVTSLDPVNAVVAHVARTVYHVPTVVVRNYNPRWRVIHEAFGLPVISSTSWGAQRIEELLTQGDGHRFGHQLAAVSRYRFRCGWARFSAGRPGRSTRSSTHSNKSLGFTPKNRSAAVVSSPRFTK